MSNHKHLLHNIIVNYGFRCHGDQRYKALLQTPSWISGEGALRERERRGCKMIRREEGKDEEERGRGRGEGKGV